MTSTVVLLHGLAGHAGEWDETARRLDARVVALDARGHGTGDRHPRDVSRAAHVAEVIAAVEPLGPVVLAGQSLGGQTAICVAAARPDLVRRLVVIEAGPWGRQFDAAALEELAGRLRAWPAERRRHIDIDAMVRTMAAFDAEDCWAEWERIECPVLLVLGERGGFEDGEAEEMLGCQPRARAPSSCRAPATTSIWTGPRCWLST